MNKIDTNELERIYRGITRNVNELEPTATPCVYVVAGSYLHGTAGPDSDIDVRGFHCVPTSNYLKVNPPEQRYDLRWTAGPENSPQSIEVTSYELRTFGQQLFKQNINLLEAVMCGQLVNRSSPAYFDGLRSLLWDLFESELPAQYSKMAKGLIADTEPGEINKSLKVNELLYAFRGALAVLNLQQGNELQVNLPSLSKDLLAEAEQEIVQELIELKQEQGDVVVDTVQASQAASIIKPHLQDTELRTDIKDQDTHEEINDWMMRVRKEVGALPDSE